MPIIGVLNPLKDKLARGELAASMTVRLVSSVEIVRIAKTAGFDAIYIDLEHSAFSIETTGQISVMALEAGIPALVRVPAAKYPPLGARGMSTGLAHLGFRSVPAKEALPKMNDATMVIVQLESAAGLEAIEDIVAVDGVDMVLIGTNDFLADLGRPGEYDHPKVREAYERTIAACRKHGKYAGVGGLSSRPDLVQQFVSLGARFVSTGTDLGFLLAACMERAKQVRSLKL